MYVGVKYTLLFKLGRLVVAAKSPFHLAITCKGRKKYIHSLFRQC